MIGFPFVEKPVLKRERKAPTYSILQHVEGYNSSETSSHHPECPRDHHRVLFYEAVDALVSSVQERFNQPSFLIFEQLESLFIKTLKGEETTTAILSTETDLFIRKCNHMLDYFESNSLKLNLSKSGYLVINGSDDIKKDIVLTNGTLEYKKILTYLSNYKRLRQHYERC